MIKSPAVMKVMTGTNAQITMTMTEMAILKIKKAPILLTIQTMVTVQTTMT